MRIGILGTGMIVQDLLTIIREIQPEYCALLSTERSRDRALDLAGRYGLDHVFFDYDEMLREEIDTVYVGLPNHLHFSFARKALERGKHVIIEKPVTANTAELEELKLLADQNRRLILEAVNLHHLPAYEALKEALGTIGSIKIVNLNYSQYSSRYDAFKRGEILPVFDCKKAGGALMDLNIYNIHGAVGLFGKPQRIRYFANVDRGIDTSGILMMDYGDFKVSCIGAKDCKAPVSLTFQGDEGVILVDTPISQMTRFTRVGMDGSSREYAVPDPKHRLYYEFVQFRQIIDTLDFDRAGQLMEISSTVCRIMEEARKQEGILFENEMPQLGNY